MFSLFNVVSWYLGVSSYWLDGHFGKELVLMGKDGYSL